MFESGEEVKETSHHETKTGFNGSIKPNRSSKSLLDERTLDHATTLHTKNLSLASATATKFIDLSEKGKNKYNNNTQSSMLRSSSASAFDREETNVSALSEKNIAGQNDDKFEPKISNINGNIIHVTVNNYISPSMDANKPKVGNSAPQKHDAKKSNLCTLAYLNVSRS